MDKYSRLGQFLMKSILVISLKPLISISIKLEMFYRTASVIALSFFFITSFYPVMYFYSACILCKL